MTLSYIHYRIQENAQKLKYMSPDEKMHIIHEIVCKYYNLPHELVFEKNRKPLRVRCRQTAWWFMRQVPKLSLLTIGRMYGYDHTTVIHGVKLVDTLIQVEPDYKAELFDIENIIKQKIQW